MTPDDLTATLEAIKGRGYRKGTAPGLRAGQLDCSGVKPPLAWNLNRARELREAITREITGKGEPDA